jgi:two-component system response regulator VicR
MTESKPLTTGQAARYCDVSQATIINWIKKGKLKAYATPGGHYRIPLADFLSFLKTYKMPVDPALRTSPRPRVLIVSEEPHAATLAQILREDGRLDITLANSCCEASAQVVRLEPDAVVLDMRSKTLDCLALCRWLRASPEGAAVPMLVVGSPEDEEAARAAGADIYIPAAAAADRLKEELETVLARERNR